MYICRSVYMYMYNIYRQRSILYSCGLVTVSATIKHNNSNELYYYNNDFVGLDR